MTFTPAESSAAEVPEKVAVDRTDPTFVGESSAERYEQKRLLGQGGMGSVFLVRDANVGRNVALKQLNEDRTGELVLARFAREARLQGQLEHPAIVPVYDVGTGPDGKPYFTMKRVRGQSLADVLEKMKRNEQTGFSRRKLLSAFSQLCAAAHYAHERGVIHRDIKPTNIMLGAYGEVYLLDWGVAKVVGDVPERFQSDAEIDAKVGVHTSFGAVMGTLTTMAPEQAVGAEVSARTDVYALGAVLFEILTGEPLHPRGEFEEVIATITRGVEARPSVRFPEAEVPPELEELCVKATKLQPADRLPSAMALRDAVEAYLDGDRDLALRKESAREHADAARIAADRVLRAKAKGSEDITTAEEEEAIRADALSQVGQALALDPSNKRALATLVSLLTTPPKFTPREIVAEYDAEQRRNIRRGGIAAAIIYAYISINAVATLSLGVHNMRIFLTAHLLWGAAFVTSCITIVRPSYYFLLTTFLFGVSASTYITSVYGPYVLVATLITIHAVLFAFVRSAQQRAMVLVVSAVAWTISVFGERYGLFPRSVYFVNGGLHINSSVMDFPPRATTFFLWAAVLFAILAAAFVIGSLRAAYHRSDLAMRVQSWQLRRLVTDGTTGTRKVYVRPSGSVIPPPMNDD